MSTGNIPSQEVDQLPQFHDGIVGDIENGLTRNGIDPETAIAIGSVLDVFSARQEQAPLSLKAVADQVGRAKAEKGLEHAQIDRVTGLKTDKSFWKAIQNCAKRMVGESPDHRSVFLFLLDLNGLKRANEAYGEMVGDGYLRVTAQAVDDLTRGSDEWYRLGSRSDEVVGIVRSVRPDKDGTYKQVLDDKCHNLAEGVKERLIAVGLPVAELHLGIKIVAGQLKPGQNPKELFKELDERIRQLKKVGRQLLPEHLRYDSRLDIGPTI